VTFAGGQGSVPPPAVSFGYPPAASFEAVRLDGSRAATPLAPDLARIVSEASALSAGARSALRRASQSARASPADALAVLRSFTPHNDPTPPAGAAVGPPAPEQDAQLFHF